MELIKTYKWLFIWSGFLLLAACVVKYSHLSKPMTQAAGLVEMLLAIAIGIAFGIKATKKED